jgi:hypothetical protein
LVLVSGQREPVVVARRLVKECKIGGADGQTE